MVNGADLRQGYKEGSGIFVQEVADSVTSILPVPTTMPLIIA